MSKCTRNFYEASVDIRRTKLESAQGGIDAVMAALKAPAVKQIRGEEAGTSGQCKWTREDDERTHLLQRG